jgi:AP2-associated kinase
MRRGRPTKPVSQHNSAKPSPSPYRGESSDPFAALDGGKQNGGNVDELSARFPKLEQFSLLHEKSSKFEFEPTVAEPKSESDELSQRVANALADDAFVKSPSPVTLPSKEATGNHRSLSSSTEKGPKESLSVRGDAARPQAPLYQPVPKKSSMVSTGTMTESSPPVGSESKPPPTRPVYRFPAPGHERRASSQPWSAERERSPSGPGRVPSQTTTINRVEPKHKSSSEKIPRLPASARPSLETSRPSVRDMNEAVVRPKSANSRSRPASVHLGSKLDFARGPDLPSQSVDHRRAMYEDGEPLRHSRTDGDRDIDSATITSDVDFLRAREEEEVNRKKEKRLSGGSKHVKRSSLSSLAISGTKGLLGGRFGDAFRRFEQNTSDSKSRTPSPNEADRRLTPITGSEVTELSDDGLGDQDRTDISPEMRRELERRRLSQEEKRVANAAAEYRLRVSGRGTGGRNGTKAPAIQNKVQSLLQDKPRPPPKTASGYGRFTDTVSAGPERPSESSTERDFVPAHPARPKPPPKEIRGSPAIPRELVKSQTASDAGWQSPRGSQRPMAPPKPKNLRTGGTGETPVSERAPSLSGGPTSPTVEDWEANFSRRYPSLSGLEMVETEIDVPKLSSIRTREI